MKRSDTVTVVKTGFERIHDSFDHRFCIWTDAFVAPFSSWGTYGQPLAAHYRSAEEHEPKVGDVVPMGRFAKVPVTNWHWFAMIRQGVNILVGSVSDGLVDKCGPLYVVKVMSEQYASEATPEMLAVARQAALTGNAQQAKRMLVESGLFADVYQFGEGVGYWIDKDCFEPDANA